MSVRILITAKAQRVAVMFFLLVPFVVLPLVSNAQSVSQIIIVAEPGVGVGSSRLGDPIPADWSVYCGEALYGFYYFALDGLIISPPPTVAPNTPRRDIIDLIDIGLYPDRILHGKNCRLPSGRPVPPTLHFAPPPSIVHVSNKGIQLGDALQMVVSSHGKGTFDTHGSILIGHYCGIEFWFDRVDNIPDRVYVIRILSKSDDYCRQ